MAMDNINVCEQHGANVVICYSNSHRECPMCVAETKMAELQENVQDLESEVDELKSG